MGIKINEVTGKYNVSYAKRHPLTGKPVSAKRININSKAEANRVHNELVIQVNELLKKTIHPTWDKFLESYFKYLLTVDITNTTRYNREKLLRYHTLPFWKGKFVNEITSEDILNVLKTRFEKNLESHKKCFLKFIRGALEYAVELRLIDRNPTPKMKFKINSKIKGVLNQEQIETLLRKAQEQNWVWYPHYAMAVFTGLRNGELYALKWENVSLEKRQILVNCSWSNKDGFKSTKSGHDRLVEIPLPLLPLLREMKIKSSPNDFVLPRLGRWDRGEQAHDLRMFLKANGLPIVNFHNLRASWATMLLNKGANQAQVMAQGGWSDLKTMMIYVRKAGIDIKGSTNVLDDLKTHGLEDAKVVEFRQM